ncbi:hypothetical protein E2C01_060354 [Portunus trituberculatus]|uniref:Uncharacterized protein n=1 Tax=Portunus trituberculatus TaxID=210409 RepID=A0A5B7HB66_PORTR|nr:hypothetical protein [Portunus trituberculatus]
MMHCSHHHVPSSSPTHPIHNNSPATHTHTNR